MVPHLPQGATLPMRLADQEVEIVVDIPVFDAGRKSGSAASRGHAAAPPPQSAPAVQGLGERWPIISAIFRRIS